MRVLALVPGDIDNQILFFPTFETLHQAYPDVQIDVVAEARAIPAYRLTSMIRRTFRFEFSELNSFADWSNLLGQMRDQDYDVILCAATRWSMGVAMWMSGIRKRIGFAGCAGAFALTRAIPLNLERYLAETYHDLLLGLDLKSPCPPIAVTLAQKDLDWAAAEQRQLGVSAGSYLLVDGQPSGNAQGSYPSYPVEQWLAVIQLLKTRQPDLPVVWLQNPHAASANLAELNPTLKVSMIDDIAKQASLVKGAKAVLSLENATLQLAVAFENPVVALFDTTVDTATPGLFLPNQAKCVGLQSGTGKIADIQPEMIVERLVEIA